MWHQVQGLGFDSGNGTLLWCVPGDSDDQKKVPSLFPTPDRCPVGRRSPKLHLCKQITPTPLDLHRSQIRRSEAGETHLWTFVRVEGIEPTNYEAERSLRHAVLYRKTSGGTDSESGSRFVERILTVVATCRQQKLNVLEYLTRCYQAHLDGQPAPSLLPASSTADQAA